MAETSSEKFCSSSEAGQNKSLENNNQNNYGKGSDISITFADYGAHYSPLMNLAQNWMYQFGNMD